jgi:hypothetical protein
LKQAQAGVIDVGVDVVEQVVDRQVLHLQVELAAELSAHGLRDLW